MSSPGGSGFNTEAVRSHEEDRDQSVQSEAQGNENSNNLNDYVYQGLVEYDGEVDAPENELSGDVDGRFFADAFLEGDYLHSSSISDGQHEDLDDYNLSIGDGSAPANDGSMPRPSGFLQQSEMVYASPENANKPTDPFPPLMQGHDSSIVGNNTVGGSKGNAFGRAPNNSFRNPAFKSANYPVPMPPELGQSMPEPSNFASHVYQQPMAFGSANPFQARYDQSGSDLTGSMSTYWNLQDPNTFVGNTTTTGRFAPPQSIAPYEQSMGQNSDQFSSIQHRNQSLLRSDRPNNPLSAIQPPRSAFSSEGQDNADLKPIASEHDLYNALREHRVKERILSDFPHRDQHAQTRLVKDIINAFRNVQGCLDNWKVLASYNATYSDRQIEIAAWQIMLKTRDAQEGGAIVRNWADSSKPEYEVYENFSDRMLVVIENLKRSKAFCKSALAVSFMSRAVDRPGAELARKEINKKLNKAKTEQCKRGKEVTDEDIQKIKQEKEAGEDQERLTSGRGRKRQRNSDDEEDDESNDAAKAGVLMRRQTRKRSKREEEPAGENNSEMSHIPAFQGHGHI